jgi:hypothetical protein
MAASEMVLSAVVIAVATAVFVLLLAGAFLVVRDTARQRGRWGINLHPPACLQCGAPAPAVRKPASLRQAMWGGWTCRQCGFELDKWGWPVEEQRFPAKWSARLDLDLDAPARPQRPTDERTRGSSDQHQRGDGHVRP